MYENKRLTTVKFVKLLTDVIVYNYIDVLSSRIPRL